jgi:hypothetical protein
MLYGNFFAAGNFAAGSFVAMGWFGAVVVIA